MGKCKKWDEETTECSDGSICPFLVDAQYLCLDKQMLDCKEQVEGLLEACKVAMDAIGSHPDFKDKDGTALELAWDAMFEAVNKAKGSK